MSTPAPRPTAPTTGDPRPRDAATTREALLTAARPLFGEHGYEGTTVSQIARAAGFSPNLVTRYFGGKEGLFLAATQTHLNNEAAPPGDAEDFGARFANQIVDRWDQQGLNDPLLALLRAASSRPTAREALGEFLELESTAPLTRVLMEFGFTEAQAVDRANAIQSFVLGTVVTRRILRAGAIPAANSADLRAWLADVIQRLVGEPTVAGQPAGYLPVSAGRHRS